ncbi:MAG: hypothetical protein JWM07_322 [Candidatus Saccharibacteria bacterium]|nr:hypothetical protein [Candidatus Saccharibacteria bacterium]
MKFSLVSGGERANAKQHELADAINDANLQDFTSRTPTIAAVYQAWTRYVGYFPALAPTRLFVIGRKSVLYPVAYQVTPSPHKNPEHTSLADHTRVPYAWVTDKKKLVLAIDGHFYFVDPLYVSDWLTEPMIDRLILSLKGDNDALARMYIDEILHIIVSRPPKS